MKLFDVRNAVETVLSIHRKKADDKGLDIYVEYYNGL
jgi:hypothetical protein